MAPITVATSAGQGRSTRSARLKALLVGLVLLGGAAGQRAQAQDGPAAVTWPRTITLLVPFGPGASNDTFARVLAQKLGPRLGTNVIVDNKPGAGGMIGAAAVARSAPTGATLMLTSSTFTCSAAVQPRLTFDPVKGLVPVAMMARGPMVFAVGASSPYKTLADVIAAAKAERGRFTYGSAGVGSINQMGTELLASMAGIEMTHVPYKGAANALTDLVGGQVQFMLAAPVSLLPHVKTGRLRALAVSTLQPSPLVPDLPTAATSVPGYEVAIWWGVFAPAGLPQPLVERLNAEIRAIAAEPEMRARFEQEGAEPETAMNPEQFATLVRDDIETWRRIAAERGITAE